MYKIFESIYMKMDKKIIKLGDTEINKLKFKKYKSLLSIKIIDINKIIVSDNVLFSKKDFKYFIGCKDTKKN